MTTFPKFSIEAMGLQQANTTGKPEQKNLVVKINVWKIEKCNSNRL